MIQWKNFIKNEELINDIIKEYIETKCTKRQISLKFNIGQLHIDKLFKIKNIPNNYGNKPCDITESELYDLYVIRKLTAKEIAIAYNFDQTTINRKLKSFDFQIKNRIKKIKIDLTDRVFGELKVVKFTGNTYGGYSIWECLCNCRNVCFIKSSYLTRKQNPKKSCGCKEKRKCDISKDELYNLYITQGLSTTKIAKIYDCSRVTVQYRLFEHKIEYKPRKKDPKNNLLGFRFGKLFVESLSEQKKYGEASWNCLCDCGKTIVVQASFLTRKSFPRRSCGCTSLRHPWRGYEEIPLCFFNRIKSGAEERNFEFDITIEDMWQIFVDQDRKCALTGLILTFPPVGKIRNADLFIASLDRIDSNKGYIKGNIQWVHKDINLMKLDHSQDEFIKMCRLVANHNPDYSEMQLS